MKEKLIKLGLTEELAQKVLDNFGSVVDGEYVTKTRFNEVNGELKTANDTIKERDKQLETIKNSNEDAEALKKQISELQEANKTAKAESEKALAAERKTNAIKLELTGKVHNTDLTMNLLKMEEIIMDENGKVKSGLKEQIDGLKKTDNYLFIPEDNGSNNNTNFQIKGATPKTGDDVPPANLSKAEVFAKNLAAKTKENAKMSAENVYFGDNNK